MQIDNTNPTIVYTPEPMDGAARYTTDFVKALRAEGVRVALFCPRNFVYADELRESGVPLLQTGERDVRPASLLRRIARNICFALTSTRSLFSAMSGGETVHFQMPLHLPLGFVCYTAVRLKKAHIVLTAHDPLPHRWRMPGRLSSFEKAMLGMSYRMADAIVVHNLSGKAILEKHFGVSASRIEVVPHGPMADLGMECDYPEFDRLKLLCFGAIRENKGIQLAIEAVQALRARGYQVELTIRGELYTASEEQYWCDCLELTARSPEGIHVEEGFVPDGQISELMAAHHAVLLPYSAFFSESGVAALAVTHARPLLATRDGGLGEMLDELHCGIAIDEPDVVSIMRAIEKAFEAGPECLREMGTSGRANLLAKRSWRTIAQRTAQIYARLDGDGRTSQKRPVMSGVN
jgi:glycogen synthase